MHITVNTPSLIFSVRSHLYLSCVLWLSFFFVQSTVEQGYNAVMENSNKTEPT